MAWIYLIIGGLFEVSFTTTLRECMKSIRYDFCVSTMQELCPENFIQLTSLSSACQLIASLIPAPKMGGRPRTVDVREILNAFFLTCELLDRPHQSAQWCG